MALAMAYCAMFKTDFPIVYGSFQHFAMNKTGFASSILMCIAHQGTSQGEALQRWRCCTGTHIVCMHRQFVATLCVVVFGFKPSTHGPYLYLLALKLIKAAVAGALASKCPHHMAK